MALPLQLRPFSSPDWDTSIEQWFQKCRIKQHLKISIPLLRLLENRSKLFLGNKILIYGTTQQNYGVQLNSAESRSYNYKSLDPSSMATKINFTLTFNIQWLFSRSLLYLLPLSTSKKTSLWSVLRVCVWLTRTIERLLRSIYCYFKFCFYVLCDLWNLMRLDMIFKRTIRSIFCWSLNRHQATR